MDTERMRHMQGNLYRLGNKLYKLVPDGCSVCDLLPLCPVTDVFCKQIARPIIGHFIRWPEEMINDV